MTCNKRFFDIAAPELSNIEVSTLLAVLNSTLIGFFKTFYGRFTGTEGSLDTEVVDVNLLDVPDSRGIADGIVHKLECAFQQLTMRPIGRLVEDQLMNCHSPERARKIAEGPIVLPEELQKQDRRALDDAVFELIGIGTPDRRKQMVNRLYEETARHFRQIRVVEIQKMEQRSAAGGRRFGADELDADAWDAMEADDVRPLREWLSEQKVGKKTITIPDGGMAYLASAQDMFDACVVSFGKDRKIRLKGESRAQAELIARLANLGIRGKIILPVDEEDARHLLEALETRLSEARARFEMLASSRTGTEKLHNDVVDLLMHWFVHGRSNQRSGERAMGQMRT